MSTFNGDFNDDDNLRVYLRYYLSGPMAEKRITPSEYHTYYNRFVKCMRRQGRILDAIFWHELLLSIVSVPCLVFINMCHIFDLPKMAFRALESYSVEDDVRLGIFLERWKELVHPERDFESRVKEAIHLTRASLPWNHNVLQILLEKKMVEAASKILLPSMVDTTFRREIILRFISDYMYYRSFDAQDSVQRIVDYVMQHGGVPTMFFRVHETFEIWQHGEQEALVLWNHSQDRVMPRVLWSLCVDYLMCRDSKRFYGIP
jgi:hypothetical protein